METWVRRSIRFINNLNVVCLGLYFDVHEILPFLKGDFRYNKTQKVSKFSSLEVEVRACVEGQFIAMRSYAEEFGFNIGELY